MIICSFSDFNKPLNEAPKSLKGKTLHDWIMKNLKDRNRISVWEIDDNTKVCRAFMYLVKIGKIKLNNKYDYPYQGLQVMF